MYWFCTVHCFWYELVIRVVDFFLPCNINVAALCSGICCFLILVGFFAVAGVSGMMMGVFGFRQDSL